MSVSSDRVDAVVVSYNVRDLLIACIESLVAAHHSGELGSIVVVDNASDDGSADAVRSMFPWVRVIDAPNRGYGAGANRGIAATSARYVLVLNPDTVVHPGTVYGLAHYLDTHPWTAVVGPLLRYPDGTVQSTRRRFPRRLTPIFESTIISEWWSENPWQRHYQMLDNDISHQPDWIVGAAMLLRREAMNQVGGFDESFWMYSEEVELCWRLRRHGWRVGYLPDVEITHHEGASSAQDVPRRQIEFDVSRVRFMRIMYGRRWATAIRWLLLIVYAIAWGRECGKWLVGHRRKLRRERMRIYASGPRTRLLITTRPEPRRDGENE